MHSDRIVEKGEYLPGASESWSSSDEADGGAYDEKREAQMDEEDEVAARDEFATTVFYNAAQSTEPHRGRAHFLPSTGDARPLAIPRDARGLASRRGRARQRILFVLSRASIEIPSAR